VVLISGYVASGRYLAPTAAELAACRAVVVPDLPGVGRSPHGAAPLDVAGLADLVADLIAGLDGPVAGPSRRATAEHDDWLMMP
jgi:pimeloyl-ACP methyl ester carboxylesterase